MSQQAFGRRQAIADMPVGPIVGGPYVQRAPVFTQVETTKFGFLALLLSLGFPAVLRLPHNVWLGLAIFGCHLFVYWLFRYLNWNVLVVDQKFMHAARGAKNGIVQYLALAFLWVVVILCALMVIGSYEEAECVCALNVAMSTLLWCTLTRRALQVAKAASPGA